MTSNRPPAQHVVDGRLDHAVDGGVGEEARGEVEDRGADLVDLVGAERLGDVADRAGEGEDQRRHGQHREERRLGGQPGHPVAHRGADGRDDDPPGGLAGAEHPRGPGEPALGLVGRAHRGARGLGIRAWAYGSHMTAGNRAATNQPPPLVGHNVVTADAALVEAVTRHAGPEVVDDLASLGAEAGTAEAREHGLLANRHEPELTTYDRYGQPDRRGRLPPVVALADGAGRRARPAGGAVGAAGGRCCRTRTYDARPASWPGPTPTRRTAARSR